MKIVVIIDAQRDFIYGALKNAAAQVAVKNIQKFLKNENYDRVFFTQDTHNSDYLETAEGEALPVEHCLCGTDGWGVMTNLVRANKVPEHTEFIQKGTFGSLLLADSLAEIANYNDVEEIVFMGFCTDICVVSNVLMVQAYLRTNSDESVPITVLSNCCAGVTPEKHEAALETMRSCQINVKEYV